MELLARELAERALSKENASRRKMRQSQVREQTHEWMEKNRRKYQEEKERQIKIITEALTADVQAKAIENIELMERIHDLSAAEVGAAHRAAANLPNFDELKSQKRLQHSARAMSRGNQALLKEKEIAEKAQQEARRAHVLRENVRKVEDYKFREFAARSVHMTRSQAAVERIVDKLTNKDSENTRRPEYQPSLAKSLRVPKESHSETKIGKGKKTGHGRTTKRKLKNVTYYDSSIPQGVLKYPPPPGLVHKHTKGSPTTKNAFDTAKKVTDSQRKKDEAINSIQAKRAKEVEQRGKSALRVEKLQRQLNQITNELQQEGLAVDGKLNDSFLGLSDIDESEEKEKNSDDGSGLGEYASSSDGDVLDHRVGKQPTRDSKKPKSLATTIARSPEKSPKSNKLNKSTQKTPPSQEVDSSAKKKAKLAPIATTTPAIPSPKDKRKANKSTNKSPADVSAKSPLTLVNAQAASPSSSPQLRRSVKQRSKGLEKGDMDDAEKSKQSPQKDSFTKKDKVKSIPETKATKAPTQKATTTTPVGKSQESSSKTTKTPVKLTDESSAKTTKTPVKLTDESSAKTTKTPVKLTDESSAKTTKTPVNLTEESSVKTPVNLGAESFAKTTKTPLRLSDEYSIRTPVTLAVATSTTPQNEVGQKNGGKRTGYASDESSLQEYESSSSDHSNIKPHKEEERRRRQVEKEQQKQQKKQQKQQQAPNQSIKVTRLPKHKPKLSPIKSKPKTNKLNNSSVQQSPPDTSNEFPYTSTPANDSSSLPTSYYTDGSGGNYSPRTVRRRKKALQHYIRRLLQLAPESIANLALTSSSASVSSVVEIPSSGLSSALASESTSTTSLHNSTYFQGSVYSHEQGTTTLSSVMEEEEEEDGDEEEYGEEEEESTQASSGETVAEVSIAVSPRSPRPSYIK